VRNWSTTVLSEKESSLSSTKVRNSSAAVRNLSNKEGKECEEEPCPKQPKCGPSPKPEAGSKPVIEARPFSSLTSDALLEEISFKHQQRKAVKSDNKSDNANSCLSTSLGGSFARIIQRRRMEQVCYQAGPQGVGMAT
jgi:hypothetical protein